MKRRLDVERLSRTYDFMKIVWDEPKRQANIAKHGLDFAAIDLDFFDGAVFRPTHSGRQQALGWLDDVLVSAVFRLLGSEAVALISLRPASSSERDIHAQAL